MGMDIYLEDTKSKALRTKATKRFEYWVRLRDGEKDESKKRVLQENVYKWYAIMGSAENGYFRISYNEYSLSYWLQYNVDESAKGDWGLEPFYSAVKDMRKPIIRSERFRQELLMTARKWYNKAVKLKDQESYLFMLDFDKSDSDKGRFIKSKMVLKGEKTNGYIEWLKELVVFAECAVERKSEIYVSC